jgi:hypothetical protein
VLSVFVERGRAEAAIRLEHLWEELSGTYNLETLCACPLNNHDEDSDVFQRICAEHSVVSSR